MPVQGFADNFTRTIFITILYVCVVLMGMPASDANALEPDEILVLANRNASRSIDLARYYMAKRQVPAENLLKLWVGDAEVCSREDYDKKIAGPVRSFLAARQGQRPIRCLLVMYGLPLKIAAVSEKPLQGRERFSSRPQRQAAGAGADTNSQVPPENLAEDMATAPEQGSHPAARDTEASLDAELTLVMAGDYPLAGWVPNPYFVGYQKLTLALSKEKVLMVSRLDGPDESLVRRMIDDSLAAETAGLKGRAYFDARWPDPGEGTQQVGYAFYDRSLHVAAEKVRATGVLPVATEATETLFEPGQCPQAALYCGWYSLAKYVDAFQWQQGAVGYHIASGECVTLKQKGSQVWCKRMIEEGVAATVGPVSEPFVQAFPVPELFFGFLMDGYLSLAECYIVSTPVVSWKMVLIGDPLYRPFLKGN